MTSFRQRIEKAWFDTTTLHNGLPYILAASICTLSYGGIVHQFIEEHTKELVVSIFFAVGGYFLFFLLTFLYFFFTAPYRIATQVLESQKNELERISQELNSIRSEIKTDETKLDIEVFNYYFENTELKELVEKLRDGAFSHIHAPDTTYNFLFNVSNNYCSSPNFSFIDSELEKIRIEFCASISSFITLMSQYPLHEVNNTYRLRKGHVNYYQAHKELYELGVQVYDNYVLLLECAKKKLKVFPHID